MIIYSINLINLPLSLVLWIIEGYLGLVFLRMALARVPPLQTNAWYSGLVAVVDAVPHHWNQVLAARWPRTGHDVRWSWAALVVLLLLVRQVLLGLIMSGSPVTN